MSREHLTIVCLSSQPWNDGMWTNKQHVMSRLARDHRVLFVNFGPRPLPALLRLKAERRQNHFGVERLLAPSVEEHHGLTVLDLWGPRVAVRALGPNHPWSVYCTFDVRRALLNRYLARQSIEDAVIWVYHPGYGPAVAEIPRKLLIYDCVDEYSEFPEYKSGDSSWLVEREAALCRASDLVFTTSQGLYEKKRPLNPERTHLVHNVGDFAHFSRARQESTPVPDDLRDLPRPIIGFLGAVSGYKLDIEWLVALAQRHREASLVLIGPVGVGDKATDVGLLEKEPNVHLLGHRPYEALPGYVKGFDVAVIPYKQNEYTANVFPIKFFELLASGKPVVISALPALAEYYDRVEVAENAETFVAACERALADPARNQRDRLALAAENTWEHRVERMLSHVDRALAKDGAERSRAP
jgi:glycosyltransferase involved in cell wall biosynthesis